MEAEATQIGPYLLLSRLGEGGMGEVWKARDTRLDRIVAIKKSKAQFTERFEQEARAVAALNHPNICTLYDVGPDYLVMEFIDGKPIKGPLPIREVIRLGGQICDALEAAHRAGITHRDLKPANILLTKSGVKLLDFGLAKMTAAFQTTEKTVTIEGTISGTPQYMAPEQLEGQPVDARTDIFALGLILHELVTGKPAFDAKSYASLMAAILHEEPSPLSPPMLNEIVRRCLAKDPDQRWQSAADVKHALSLVERDQPSSTPTKKKLIWWPLAAALALGGLLAFLAMPKPAPSLAGLKVSPIANEPRSEGFPRFSPDGKSVAFTRLVDGMEQLFVLSLDSPNPLQLTRISTGCQRPMWSPDGNRIFYWSANAVWSVTAAGGQPQRIQDKVGPQWAISPDRQQLVFVDLSKENNAVFYLSSPPGSEPRKLTASVPTSGFVWPEFAPSGNSLLVATSEGFWRIPLPDGEAKHVVPGYGGTWWAWHPNSRHIAVAQMRGIQLVDIESGRSLDLLRGTDVFTTLHVSPEGSRIAYTSGIADYDLVELSLDGKTVTPLFASSRVEMGGAWSPKGDRFAYLAVFPEEFRLCVRRPGEDHVAVLYSGNASSLFSKVDFSSDGARIAFSDGNRVAVVPVEGGSVAVLATTASPEIPAVAPTWSPDGNSLVFLAGGYRAQLVRLDSNGNQTTLAQDARGGGANATSWSADGKWIAYTATDGIRIISPEGKNGRRLTESNSNAFAFGPGNREFYRLERTPEHWQLVIHELASGKERSISTSIPIYNGCRRMSLHPDGKRFLLDLSEQKYDIWMLSGVPQPETGIARLWRNWRN